MKDTITIRIGKEAHQIAKISAAIEGLTLREYIEKTLKEADKRKK